MQVNERMVEQILAAADKMAHRLHSSHQLSIMDILRWPGVMETAEQDFTPVQEAALALLEQTLDSLLEAREREGARLSDLIAQRVRGMRSQVETARERMPIVIEAVRERLRARRPRSRRTSTRKGWNRRWPCLPSASMWTKRWIACVPTWTR